MPENARPMRTFEGHMKTIEYPLTHASLDYIELNHLLKLIGFADSGGSGGALVTTGVVKVDGQVELRKRNKIRPGQVVQIEDTEIRVIANPEGVIAAVPREPSEKTSKAKPSQPHRRRNHTPVDSGARVTKAGAKPQSAKNTTAKAPKVKTTSTKPAPKPSPMPSPKPSPKPSPSGSVRGKSKQA
jgi:ribosome-associated protein